MERLTQWVSNGTCRVAALAAEHEEKHTTSELIDLLLDKLATYEDTYLTPEEIRKIVHAYAEVFLRGVSYNRVRELVEAEKAGRLLLVPCHGEVLYEVDGEHGVVKHIVTDSHWMVNTMAQDDQGMVWADYYTDEEIETAFPNRETAETAQRLGMTKLED